MTDDKPAAVRIRTGIGQLDENGGWVIVQLREYLDGRREFLTGTNTYSTDVAAQSACDRYVAAMHDAMRNADLPMEHNSINPEDPPP